MAWQDQIVIDPNILVGKPVIKGTRLAVEFIIELLAQGWTEEDILGNYVITSRHVWLMRARYFMLKKYIQSMSKQCEY